MQRIAVGVDGSTASRRALHWAVDHARTCGAEVQVIHAWTVPDMGAAPFGQMFADRGELEEQARRELRLVVDSADERGLVAPIERKLVCDDPATALLDAAKGADLVVVGSRGLGKGGDAALGSVSLHVIRDAHCPVVVVPPETSRPP
jgi:nucleotide-binding universal stress UspA family protein